MHSRDRELYLKDIADSCSKILRYAESLNRTDFFQDEKTYDAVLRNLEIIGEAAKNVDDEFRQDNPDIDWRKIAGLPDVISHAYFGIDEDVIWDVVSRKIPKLEQQIDELI